MTIDLPDGVYEHKTLSTGEKLHFNMQCTREDILGMKELERQLAVAKEALTAIAYGEEWPLTYADCVGDAKKALTKINGTMEEGNLVIYNCVRWTRVERTQTIMKPATGWRGFRDKLIALCTFSPQRRYPVECITSFWYKPIPMGRRLSNKELKDLTK